MSQDKTYEVWKNTELSKSFLEGVRGAIPLATEQINILLKIIRLTQPQVENFGSSGVAMTI
jgi:tRNA (cmo5U34)-methyltransferase